MNRISRGWARALWTGALAAAVLAAGPALAAAKTPAAPAPSAACTAASDACTEWVPLDKAGARSLIYRSYPLTRPNAHIRRALIMVHGTLRNADHYFTTATGAGFLAKALDDTIIIAPAIRSADAGCKDALKPNEVSWSCRGDTWR